MIYSVNSKKKKDKIGLTLLNYCTVGWSDFLEKNWTHVLLYQIFKGPQSKI